MHMHMHMMSFTLQVVPVPVGESRRYLRIESSEIDSILF